MNRSATAAGHAAAASGGASSLASPRPRRELTEDERQEVKQAFDLFDTDKDGALDYHELKVQRAGGTSGGHVAEKDGGTVLRRVEGCVDALERVISVAGASLCQHLDFELAATHGCLPDVVCVHETRRPSRFAISGSNFIVHAESRSSWLCHWSIELIYWAAVSCQ